MMLNNNFDDVLKQEVFQTLIRCVADLDLETYLVGGFVRDHIRPVDPKFSFILSLTHK